MPQYKLREMSEGTRALFNVLVGVGGGITLAFFIWWFYPSHIPQNFRGLWHALDFAIFGFLSYIVWYQICYEIFSWYLASHMHRPVPPMLPEPELRVALLTAFVPGKEPYELLDSTLRAMVAVRYPHDTWLLDEGNDKEAARLCERYGVKHYSRHGQSHYNTEEGTYKAKTKAGNYNSWFDQHAAHYDIVGQHDVDFVPHKEFFIRTLGYFIDPQVAFVGTPQVYGNKGDSWIAHGAAEQAYGFYGPIQKGLYGHDMQLFIGANHIVRVKAHKDIEGYAGHIVEDHLTGMRLYARGWKSVYVPEILAVGEGPATWDAYFSQQMRWAYGLMDILWRHSPQIFKKMRTRHSIHYFLLQQYYFYGIAQAVGILLISLYFLFGIQSTQMPLLPLLGLYVPLILWQLLIFFWLQRFNVDPTREKGLLWRGRLLSIAAWPVYFLAFVGVLVGKRMTYVVTPKGKGQVEEVPLSIFVPHFVLGTVTAFDLIASIVTKNNAPQILFWAAFNTIYMYGLFFSICSGKILRLLKAKLAPTKKLAVQLIQ